MKQYKIEEFTMNFDKTIITDYCVDNKLFKTREEANNWCNKFNNSSEEVSKQLINR